MTHIYTLSLHDALPIYLFDEHRISAPSGESRGPQEKKADENKARKTGQLLTTMSPRQNSIQQALGLDATNDRDRDRKSTRLNSSHVSISYAVFCLKKKT